MNSRVIHRLLTGLIGVAALALLVPSLGLGAIRPDDRSGPLGAAPATYTGSYDDVFMRAVARHEAASTSAVRPDDRSGPLGVGSIVSQPTTVAQIRPDDRSGPLGAQPITTASRTVSASLPTTSSSSDGFQWRDAALGAAGMLAICMVALGAVTLQRQHRRSAIAH
jgi:uncharacterized iron-regulated membrane protein